jgi:hypothetical protein
LAEQRTFNPLVVGSSPTGPTSVCPGQNTFAAGKSGSSNSPPLRNPSGVSGGFRRRNATKSLQSAQEARRGHITDDGVEVAVHGSEHWLAGKDVDVLLYKVNRRPTLGGTLLEPLMKEAQPPEFGHDMVAKVT